VHQTDFACLSATRSVPTWSGLAARLTGLTALITASIERDRDGKRGINVLTAYFWRCSDADERIWSFNITIARCAACIQLQPLHKIFTAILINCGKHGERSHNAPRHEDNHQCKTRHRPLAVSQDLTEMCGILWKGLIRYTCAYSTN